MPVLYELAVLGAPSADQLRDLEAEVARAVSEFGLALGVDIAWQVKPHAFGPSPQRAAAAVFFGGPAAPLANVPALLARGVPVLPVASTIGRVSDEIPVSLRRINCLAYDVGGAGRTATALLESVGLLPRDRRLFMSYRRDESRQAALQLFEALSARVFDVFLDTHDIAPGEDVQAVLWHRLCDADVLVMLDTPGYFASRWTDAEFGRALAKGIAVLRIGWPDFTPSTRTGTASRVELLKDEVLSDGRLAESAIERICHQLEAVRSQSHAVRFLNLASCLRDAAQKIGGTFVGHGPNRSINITLPDGTDLVAYPSIGVPTSKALHTAIVSGTGRAVAVVYDHVGMLDAWLEHLDWLGKQVTGARWIRSAEAAWQLAGWRT